MEVCSILIVEDENIVAMDLARTLKKTGYEVVGTASSGTRAIQLAAEKSPDIILMDIHIKGNIDGIEVAEKISTAYQIPIIFLTAYSEDQTVTRASKVKPYGYLLKPFSDRELHVSIQIALERHQADRLLLKRETHFKLALDAANLGTWEMESSESPIILGYNPWDDLGLISNWEELTMAVVPDHQDKVLKAIASLRDGSETETQLEFKINSPDTGHRWLLLHGKSFLAGHRKKHRAVGVIRDITEHYHAQEQLKQSNTAFQFSADGIIVLDIDLKVKRVNEAFCKITGLESQECLGKPLQLLSAEYLGEEKFNDILAAVNQTGSWQGEVSLHHQDSDLHHVLISIASTPGLMNQEADFVVVLSDITEIREVQEQLSYIAYYDGLTGLPNRNLFMDRLDMCLAKAKRENSRFGILFLDLDNFKRVNDSLGHQVGDKLLTAVARRLKSGLRMADTLCRIGGDEFIIIAELVTSLSDLQTLARKILDILDQPIQLGNLQIVPSASIGICMYPDHTTNRDEMIKMADTAMYASKTKGYRDFAVYHPDMYEHVAQYFQRDQELRHALKNNEFRLYYQPQFDACCGNLIGWEALIRWQHPKQGLLGPAQFINIAESSTLILNIGQWVLEESCRQLRTWLDLGLNPGKLSINVSARQLDDRKFVQQVHKTTRQLAIPMDLLVMEVTESCLQNSEVGLHNLNLLKKMGIAIAIDDFGTGYSCLSSLKTLPITTLKIDRNFVKDIHTDPNERAIANAIIALAKQLDLYTIAEGVELQSQAHILRASGCNFFQGYFYSKPLPSNEATRLLRPACTDIKVTSEKAG